jgi:hypothetical protein
MLLIEEGADVAFAPGENVKSTSWYPLVFPPETKETTKILLTSSSPVHIHRTGVDGYKEYTLPSACFFLKKRVGG